MRQRRSNQDFSKNLGNIDNFNFPYNHESALKSFENFLSSKLEFFGPYEDAIPKTDSSLFHSVLTPFLNIGLISPKTVIQMTLEHAKEFSIPINSLEGFIRQIIGWREFIRGIYQESGVFQRTRTFGISQKNTLLLLQRSNRSRPCRFYNKKIDKQWLCSSY